MDKTTTTEAAEDLFSGTVVKHAKCAPRRRPVPSELANARVLCRQLTRKRSRPDKQRVAHCICLNLLSMLKRGRVGLAAATPRKNLPG